MKRIFKGVYERREWGSGSGPGSNRENLAQYFAFLSAFINSKSPKSIVDLGCGFFLPYSDFPWGDIQYLGIDVVPSCVKDNSNYQTPSRSFLRADWQKMEVMPEADLAICKDVLQHWSHQDICKGMQRLSKYRWVLLVNTIEPGSPNLNCDIPTGGFRPLNLLASPYNLEATEHLTYELNLNQGRDVKLICVWEPARFPFKPFDLS